MADLLTPDLCIIGAGAAGLALAEAAREAELSVVLVERDRMGGGALYAAVAAQALYAAGRHAHAAASGAPFGIANEAPKVNFRRLHDHIDDVVAQMSATVSLARFTALGVTVLGEDARFLDRRTVLAGETQVRAKAIVLATGSRPVVPEIEGLANVPFMTTDTVFDNTRKLSHLVLIGGGGHALAMAQAYRRLGAGVSLLAPGPALPDVDPELAGIALRRLRQEGLDIHEHTSIEAIHARPLGIGVEIGKVSGSQVLDASHILVMAGREPAFEGLDLDKAGIRLAPGGRGPVLTGLRTSVPHVYAIGEAAGIEADAAAARHQARQVLDHILYGLPQAQGAMALPSLVHTDPEIAEYGLTEPQIRRRQAGSKVLRWSLAESVAGRAMRDTEGLVKLVLDARGIPVGVGIVGPGAAELIAPWALAITQKIPLAALSGYVAPFASIGQALPDLAHAARAAAPLPLYRKALKAVRARLP